jgi:hypothetical protein
LEQCRLQQILVALSYRAVLAQSVEFDAHMMRVTFIDGRQLGVPFAWFPTLKKATPAQRGEVVSGE